MMECNSNALEEKPKLEPIGSLPDNITVSPTDLEHLKFNMKNSPDLNHDTEDDIDIDVVGCPSISGQLTEPVCGEDDADAAEYSSSFGETSDSNEKGQQGPSDTESSDSTRTSKGLRLCRRKKLTNHWQRYIRSVKWRCNWLELRIKELQSRNLKRKQRLLAVETVKSAHMVAVSAANSSRSTVSLSFKLNPRAMRRRKRKRYEESVDLSAYIASHHIFSLLAASEKGSEADAVSFDDGLGENGLIDGSAKGHDGLAVDHDWPTIDLEESKSSHEIVYLLIEALQERVLKLRAELDLGDDAGELTLTMPVLPLEAAASRSRSASPELPIYLSEYETDDLPLSESAMSSFEGVPQPNIIECTVNLLSADRIGGMDLGDDILISNQAAKEELEDFESVGKPMERAPGGARVSGSETGSEPERVDSEETVTMRRCSEAAVTYVRRSNRPRTQRRLSPSSWHCEIIGPRRSSKTLDHS